MTYPKTGISAPRRAGSLCNAKKDSDSLSCFFPVSPAPPTLAHIAALLLLMVLQEGHISLSKWEGEAPVLSGLWGTASVKGTFSVPHLVTEKVSSTTLVRPAEGNLVWSVYIPVKNKYQSPPLLPGSLGITKAPVTSADTMNVRTINVSVPRRNSSWVRNSQWNWHPAGKDPGMSVLGHIEGLPGPVFCVPCSSRSTLNVSRSIPELWEQLATDLLSWIRWTCPMFSWTRDHSSRLLVRSCPHAREHPWALVIDMTFRARNGCP